LKKIAGFLTALILFILGCGGLAPTPEPTLPPPAFFPTWTFSPLPTPTVTAPVPQFLFPTNTVLPSPSITPTETPSPTPEPKFRVQGPGRMLVPILLYHQIGYSNIKDNPYYVSPEEFEKQIYLLHAWGYQTITVRQLAVAILAGAELPVKPIVLTFDDGNDNTYTRAFPVLQKYGFTGTAYLVHNFIGAAGFMTKAQILELYEAGWEIGSHSLSHVDLTTRPDRQEAEIIESNKKLENLLQIPIETFAYPFGAYDDLSLYYMPFSGYLAAVGLGADMQQGPGNLFYLYRREVKGTYDLKTFAGFLPWRGDLENLPAPTILP
jgi:peptidoglycan/xylan/chitin deacetylase (PgdA/CDA1 family)